MDNVNKTEFRLIILDHTILASRFVIKLIAEGALACDLVSRVFKVIVADLSLHAAANIIELFVQIFVVLQGTKFLESVLMMWPYDSLRPCL